MGWKPKTAPTNLVQLGDEEGQVTEAKGLLASIKPNDNPKFKNPLFDLIVNATGDRITLAGLTALTSLLTVGEIGRFVKISFLGWKRSKGGSQYKDVEVAVWPEEELTPAMRSWPEYDELQKKRTQLLRLMDEEARTGSRKPEGGHGDDLPD